MTLIRFLLRVSPRTVGLAILSAMVGGLATAGVIACIRWFLIEGRPPIPEFLWIFLGFSLGAVLSKLIAQFLLISLTRRSMTRQLLELCRRILAAPLAQLERMGPAQLRLALTADVHAVVQGLGTLPLIAANSAIVAACLGYLGYLSLPVMLAVVLALGVGLAIQSLLIGRAHASIARTREGQETVAEHLDLLVSGVKELKLHHPRRDVFVNHMLQNRVGEQERQAAFAQQLLALSDAIGRAVLFTLLGFLVMGLSLLEEPRPGNLSSYLLIVFFLMQPLSAIKYLLPQLARAKISLIKLQALGLELGSQPEPGSGTPPPIPVAFSQVELKDVTFRYPSTRDERPFTLGPLSVTFQPGEIVFLSGGNGSGKTTFAKLLLGLYSPTQGEMRWDGRPLTAENRDLYRQLFTAIFPDSPVVPGLIGLNQPRLLEQAREWLARFRLDHRVTILSDGVFSTTRQLSRGQMKRLALLVSLLENRPFYVLDEWAAEQDPYYRDLYYREVLPALRKAGKTVLVITHDERYDSIADRRFVLQDGQLMECPREGEEFRSLLPPSASNERASVPTPASQDRL